MLITFEGIDGSGKSTQIKLLADYLKRLGQQVILFREPGSSLVSEKIRDILLDNNLEINPYTELLLFEAARAELVEKEIIPAINNGITILLDRFYDSTTAYQGYGRDLDITSVKQCNLIATQGIKPDLTYFLDISIKTSSKRSSNKEKDRMENAGNAFYKSVIAGYKQIAKEEPDRFFIIDASGDIADTHNLIVNILRSKL